MCDTLVCLPDFTKNGHTIFAKNSDREPEEAQSITILKRQNHSKRSVRTTFIDIPQVSETYACILFRPFQMWGTEMGVNEHSVVIGNEAVFTKIKIKKDNSGLTGMDLLRLALERAGTAQEAKEVITTLLEEYGQDACGGYKNKSFFYHNSFIIADPNEAYVLETAGRHWASEKINGIRSISNRLSISENYSEISTKAIEYAIEKKWCNDVNSFSFAGSYSDWLMTTFGRGRQRQSCTTEWMKNRSGKLNPEDFFEILATHHLNTDTFHPRKANTSDICMHATSFLNPSDTTGSMIADLSRNKPPVVWVTGTSHPCMSVFFPIFQGFEDHQSFLVPSGKPDNSLWWLAKKAQQKLVKRYRKEYSAFRESQLMMQSYIAVAAQELIETEEDDAQRHEFTARCLEKLAEFYNCFLKKN